jgi:adenine-specific DNA-methyltransferase
MSSVWYCKQEPRRGTYKHLTKLPDALVSKMLAYSSRENDLVADFFLGSGTTVFQAQALQRCVIGFEQHPDAFRHITAQLPDFRAMEEDIHWS